MVINVTETIAWLQAGQTLVLAGVATVQNIRAWIQAQHPGLTDAALDAICDDIIAGASRHKAMAEADQAGG